MNDSQTIIADNLFRLALDSLNLAVTIIDPQGRLLYYNRRAAEILDRRPEYIGADAHAHHRKAASNHKLDLMLEEFGNGRREPFHYRAIPYGKPLLVTVSPILEMGRFVGCTQSVRLEEENP
jgi:PAS domain-containing protein